MRPWRGTVRELFESAREANADAERCQRQLQQFEDAALRVGGASFEPHVNGTRDPDRMARRVGAMVDREERLRKRLDDDYELVDYATRVLYGEGGEGGLCESMSGVAADILWWRYCAGKTWNAVAESVAYSVRQCQIIHDQAFRHIQERGIEETIHFRAADVGGGGDGCASVMAPASA